MAASKKKKKSRKKSSTARATRVFVGLFFTVLTIYTLGALVSFVFTWTEDQSLLFNPDFLKNGLPANSGGKLGLLWADLLVSKLFGLGAFILPVFLGVCAVSCLRIRCVNLFRVSILSVFGAILFSVLFAFIFDFTPYCDLLGNGAGGSYGHFANRWLCGMCGRLGTGCILFLALFMFAAMLSPKVVDWFDRMVYGISHREKRAKEFAGRERKGSIALDSPDDFFDELSDESADELENETSASGYGGDDLYGEQYEDGEEQMEDDYSVATEDDYSGRYGSRSAVAEVKSGVTLDIEKSENDYLSNLSAEDVGNRYDPRLDLPRYQMPPVSLLNDYRDKWYEVSREELEKNKTRIVNALDSYKIKVTSITAKMGPTVTLYKIHLADGVKIAQVRRLEEDIAISLGAKGVRVVTLLDSVGIEVANEQPSVVALKAIINSPQFRDLKMELPLAMGITVTNEPFFLDLAKMPHLLVAGATGMGKSVGLNTIIASLLFTKHPAELKMVLVDPKKVELSLYSKLEKHFLAQLPDSEEAIITDTKKVVNTLKSLCNEMESRYDLLKLADVRQLKEYNEKFLSRRLNPMHGHKFLPYIVVIIDEFADLLMTAGREIEEPIARLAQKARAVGIHLVIATQRPTTDIITGTIKANFNSRIAFKVNSMVDSKTIIDTPGANRLIGRGDMLVVHPGADLTRVQCALIDTPEIKEIVGFINGQNGYSHPFFLPEYVDESEEGGVVSADLHKRDALFEDCAKLVVQTQQGSTSMLQRKLGVGYARAGKIMDQLEAAGIVGPQEGSKARIVLVTDFDSLDRIIESLNHV